MMKVSDFHERVTCDRAACAPAQLWLTCTSQPATRRRPVAMVLAAPAVCALGCGVLRAQHHPRLHCGCAAQPSRDVRRPVQRARAFPLRQPGYPVAGGQKKMQRRWPVRAPHCLMVHFGHDVALWAPCKALQARWVFFRQAQQCCQTRHKV